MKVRTQKARGLRALAKSKIWGENTPNYKILQSKKDIDNNQYYFGFPAFARPCPTVPRHGFVDSTVVKNKQGLIKLLENAQKVDPKAEVVVMDKVQCEASAILTPTQVTIGPSNDGATQGRDAIVLPIGHLKRSQKDESAAGITSAPYYEILFKEDVGYQQNDLIKSVQLRNGPASAVTGNYIPNNTIVNKVLIAHEHKDLLGWEETMQKATKGTVVYHPGGSSVSHYSVHAVLNKIPVIFDKKPKVGDKLIKNVDRVEHFYNEMVQGIKDGLSIQKLGNEHIEYADSLNLVLFSSHNALSLIKGKDGAHCLGMGAALALRLGMAACIGEATYADEFSEKWESKLGTDGDYDMSFQELQMSRKAMPDAFSAFAVGGLAGGDCYGGDAWAACAGSTLRVDKHIKAFGLNPNDNTFAKLVGELHTLVNLSHNSGNFLNKFDYGYSETFDEAADADPRFILRGALAYWRYKKNITKPHKFNFDSMTKYSFKGKGKKAESKKVFLVVDKECNCCPDASVDYYTVVTRKFYDSSTYKRVSDSVAEAIIKKKPKYKTLYGTEINEADQRVLDDYADKHRGYILTPALIKMLSKSHQKTIKNHLKYRQPKKTKTLNDYLKQEKLNG